MLAMLFLVVGAFFFFFSFLSLQFCLHPTPVFPLRISCKHTSVLRQGFAVEVCVCVCTYLHLCVCAFITSIHLTAMMRCFCFFVTSRVKGTGSAAAVSAERRAQFVYLVRDGGYGPARN